MSASRSAATPHRNGPLGHISEVAHDVASAADDLWDKLSGNRRTAMNFLLVGLCWVSLIPNAWLIVHTPHHTALHHAILNADLGIEIALGAAICWRWLRFRVGRRYLRKRLWEIPALFPFIIPVVGHWQIVLWLVLLARLARVVDRTDSYFGDKIMAALIEHFTEPIVDAIKRPITIAVMDEVIDVLRVGTYALNVRDALEENHAEIEQMILDLVYSDPTTKKLKYVPFHDDIVKLTCDTVLRIVDGALVDPRTTEIIEDAIRNSAEQIRTALHSGVRAAEFKARDA